MEPVEINAGNWYLLAEDSDGWDADSRYRWSVREATTADAVAEVTLMPDGTVSGSARDGEDAALTAARRAVRGFAEAALGLTVRDA
ncbi:hypothetical protein [Rhodococcus phenolicus]|uniref:hypothetical protein n=1 Tax=Rhodococcus phenolicus TaxID=263849 RepID=UPI00082E9B5F|nr:hypothetical protein [Rhodococcus phenolicus]